MGRYLAAREWAVDNWFLLALPFLFAISFLLAGAAGLPFFILFELALLLAVLKLIFSGTATAEEVSQRTGAPPFIARLMLLEAKFWRAVWRLISRR